VISQEIAGARIAAVRRGLVRDPFAVIAAHNTMICT
jgi:hypothetical protein